MEIGQYQAINDLCWVIGLAVIGFGIVLWLEKKYNDRKSEKGVEGKGVVVSHNDGKAKRK